LRFTSFDREVFLSPQFHYMSNGQCRKMHFAALEILERFGVRLYLEEAIALLKKAGCDVSDGNLVRIPAGLVERAFSTVPKRVVLADRNGRRVLPLENNRTFFGPGSDCLNILDHRTNVRRKALLSDVAEGVILCDALPEIDFVMSMVLPSDVDMEIADRYQMEIMLNNTSKPLIFVTYEFDGCVDVVEMAECVAGGEEALRRNPFLACYINVTTGFNHNKDALQKLLYLSGKGLPFMYIPDGNAAVTGPVTVPGAAAIVLAGTLAGLVISQLNREGSPFIMAGWGGGTIDLKTMVIPYCYPTARNIMQAMSRYYGIPSFGLGGTSDAKVVDQQAASEAALTLMVEVLTGSDLLHDLGYLEAGLTFSFSQLVICSEIVSWIKDYLKPIDISDETLALDVIEEIGMNKDYLSHPHTFKHFRRHWYPKLFERGNYENWVSAGGKTLAERAAEKVEDILAQHQPEKLPEDIQKSLKEFVQRAESRKKAKG
jgi:trimethylamine--corrinoid protein Co-methyltransferase